MNTKDIKHQIPKTIAYGLACGLSFVPLSLTLDTVISWPSAFCLTLWLFISGYAILLSRWSNTALISIVFPLLLLVPTIFLMNSSVLFFLLALIVISWVRSGICFLKRGAIQLTAELLLCILGGILVVVFTPGSLFAWAVGVWMFFLVQALYFVFFEQTDNRQEEPARMDAFERASRQADRILTDVHYH
jgi:hypothetical protein